MGRLHQPCSLVVVLQKRKQLGASIKACIAKANKVQKDGTCRHEAARARSSMLQLLKEADRSAQDACSICLDELQIAAPTTADQPMSRVIVLLPCLHCFHIECVSRWRLHSRRCPLCQNDLRTLDQMLFAGKYINGDESQFGRLAQRLTHPHDPMQGQQPESTFQIINVGRSLPERLMDTLRVQDARSLVPYAPHTASTRND